MLSQIRCGTKEKTEIKIFYTVHMNRFAFKLDAKSFESRDEDKQYRTFPALIYSCFRDWVFRTRHYIF